MNDFSHPQNRVAHSPIDRDRPWAPELNVKTGRDAYLNENGFTVGAYDATLVRLSFFRLNFVLPNPASRRKAVRVHDLHHLVTGYGTDLVGEAEVSAWEMRRGFKHLGWYPSALVTSAVAIGLLLSPRRTLAAWRNAPGAHSLFGEEAAYDQLLTLSIGELRAKLGVPKSGLSRHRRWLHPLANKSSDPVACDPAAVQID